MAFTVWGSLQKQAAWAKQVIYEAQKISNIGRFIGDGPNNIIERKHDLQKVKGDRIYFDLFMQMTGDPITGNNELSGNEKQLSSYTDDVLLDRTRDAFVKYGDLDDMYSQKSLVSIGKQILSMRFADIINEYAIRWLSGDTTLTWPESVPALDSSRVAFGGDATGSVWEGTDDIASGDWLGTYEVSRIKTLAMDASPRFRPIKAEGGEYYVLFIHERQAFTLRNDSTFQAAQREAMPRGKDNPLFTGLSFVGYWDGVLIYIDQNILTGNSDTEARAILCGAQAGMMAMGKGPKATYEVTDHENRHSIGLDLIWGLRRSIFNSVDFAVYAMDTYATAPAGVSH